MKQKWYSLEEITNRKIDGMPKNAVSLAFDAIRFGWKVSPLLTIEAAEQAWADLLTSNAYFETYPGIPLFGFEHLPNLSTSAQRRFVQMRTEAQAAATRKFLFYGRYRLDVSTMPENVREEFGWRTPKLLTALPAGDTDTTVTARDWSLFWGSERWFSIADLLALRLREMPTSERTLRSWMAAQAPDNSDHVRAPKPPRFIWSCYWSVLPAAARADFSTRRRNAELSSIHLTGSARESAMWEYMVRAPVAADQLMDARSVLLSELQRRVEAGAKETRAAIELAAEIAGAGASHPLWRAACAANAKRRGLSYRALLMWRKAAQSAEIVR